MTLSINDQQIAILENIDSENQVLEQIDFEVTGGTYLEVTEDNYHPNGIGDYFLVGDNSNNFMTGSDYDDNIIGFGGDDTLIGGASNDLLRGFDDNDILQGNKGNDTLIGGTGNDTFVFNTRSTGIDEITDFEISIDKIQIGSEFGATSDSQFSFDDTNGALSFEGQQFATLSNYATLDGFDVSRDIVLV